LKDKLHILAVDDEQEILLAIKRTLEKEGYKVSIVNTAKDCLLFLQEDIPDLILLDVMLPDMNGISLAQQILSDEKFYVTPILLMSGLMKSQVNVEHGFEAGAVDFISKPLRMRDLKQKVYSIFRIKELEYQRFKQETRYDELVDSVSDLIFVLDLEGRIRFLNKSFERITGFDLKKWESKAFSELLTKDAQDIWFKIMDDLTNNRKQPKFTIHFNTKEDRIVPVDILISEIFEDEIKSGYLGIAVDLSTTMLYEYSKKEEEKLLSHEREQNIWETLSQKNTSITAQTFETTVLNNPQSETYRKLLNSYGSIIEKNIEARIYKVKYDTSKELKTFAQQVGFLNGNPKDVISLHKAFFKTIDKSVHPKKMLVYLEESRIILLEIMGYLANYYRTRV
jgi:PAS domain S-box-containing protein